MKLHLGCGIKHLTGFVNIDIREEVAPDLIDDIGVLSSVKDESAEEIYVCHVLEHFDRNTYAQVLKRWYEVLEPGGVLKISVPDFESIADYYSCTKDLTKLMGLLYGGQTYKENYHYCTWDFNLLKDTLTGIGFKHVERYNWQDTEHREVDDFSQAYLPHMNKETGKLMSLNVKAIK